MRQSFPPPIIWILLPVAFLIGGMVLAWLGLRGRRIDDHPLCRKCGFDLVGLPPGSDKCSECGADLTRPRAIRHGHRKRRPAMLAFGLLAVVLVLGLIGVVAWSQVRDLDRYRIMPTWLLMREARFPGAQPPTAAWRELLRRYNAKTLGGDRAAEAVELALAIQGDRTKTWNVVLGDFIEAAQDGGDVVDSAWQRYARQAPTVTVSFRTQVRRGDDLPMRLAFGNARVGSNSRLQVRVYRANAQGDLIRPVDPDREGSGYSGVGLSVGGGASSARTINLDQKAVAAAPLGVREAVARPRFEVRERPNDDNDPVIAKWDEDLKATWELVEADAPTLELIADESYRAAIVKGTQIRRLSVRRDKHGDHVNLDIDFKSLPVPIACEVFLREPGGPREWRLSTINNNTGRGGYGTGGRVKDFAFDLAAVDLVFRPSPKTAAHTIDMTRMWNHEFVIANVPVQPDTSGSSVDAPSRGTTKPASAPATTTGAAAR